MKWRHETWNKDLIRERYDLSMARIRDFLTEETVPEVYRDYFKKGDGAHHSVRRSPEGKERRKS